jgi:hypothetical protein
MRFAPGLVITALMVVACSGPTPPAATDRTYRMGFSANPPRLTVESVVATIHAWRTHADIAQITKEIPWRALLADSSPAYLVNRDLRELAEFYRGNGMPLIVELDVTNGLDRSAEGPELVALGRSIAEPSVQAKYREYVAAIDTVLDPEWLALAMETNLVRVLAPAPTYAALKTMVNSAANDLAARQSPARRFVTVQVETAWGRLPAVNHFVGIGTDRADFPFIQAIGLSSYPFLGGFDEPEDVPIDYYTRVGQGSPALPMLVLEGGWSSASVTGVTSTPEKQARWIRRQMQLADHAALAAVTQITFTDLDLSTYPVPPNSILPLFAHLGLVNTELVAKPALAEWDKVFARPRR